MTGEDSGQAGPSPPAEALGLLSILLHEQRSPAMFLSSPMCQADPGLISAEKSIGLPLSARLAVRDSTKTFGTQEHNN